MLQHDCVGESGIGTGKDGEDGGTGLFVLYLAHSRQPDVGCRLGKQTRAGQIGEVKKSQGIPEPHFRHFDALILISASTEIAIHEWDDETRRMVNVERTVNW